MDEVPIETYLKEQLGLHFRNLTIDESLINHWQSVETYSGFLWINLENTFQMVCKTVDTSMVQSIKGIYFPFRDFNIQFSIEVYNKDYLGRYTAFCPELSGCITEGHSKIEALKNLCYAIAEVLILNYDFLKINPLNIYANSPTVTKDFFFPNDDSYSYNFSKILSVEAKYNRFYLSKKHLLLKNDDYPKVTLTLLHTGFQQLTKHLLKVMAGLE